MKLSDITRRREHATEAIQQWIAVAVWIVVAIVVADWIATRHLLRLAGFAGIALTIILAAGMKRSAWLWIVVGWSLTGYIHALPVPLAARDLVVLLVACSYAVQRVSGQASRQSWGVLGALVAINCAHMAVTFLYHPVGLRALGAETMGGRPYFNIFIAWCAYWVIVHQPDSYRSVTRIPLWLMAGMSLSTLISVVVYIFPAITPYVWYLYGSVDVSEYTASLHAATSTALEPQVRRFAQLAPFGLMLVQFLSAYYPPRTLLNPLRRRFYLFVLGIAAVLASGFRNTLLFAFASLVLASWFHRGWREVVLGGAIGTLLLGILIFGQGRFYELPLPAQRALSFLPGQWADPVEQEVRDSNRRFDWWRQMIEEGIIKNWWVGDGFGVSENDYELLRGHFTEFATLSGAFHNGPLSTIR